MHKHSHFYLLLRKSACLHVCKTVKLCGLLWGWSLADFVPANPGSIYRCSTSPLLQDMCNTRGVSVLKTHNPLSSLINPSFDQLEIQCGCKYYFKGLQKHQDFICLLLSLIHFPYEHGYLFQRRSNKNLSQKQNLDIANSTALESGSQPPALIQAPLPLKSLASEFVWLTPVFHHGTVIWRLCFIMYFRQLQRFIAHIPKLYWDGLRNYIKRI